MKEHIFFHKGLEWGARSALQEPGALSRAENVDLSVDGQQYGRPNFSKLSSTQMANSIHSLRRFEDLVIAGHGASLVSFPATPGGSATVLGSAFTSAARWRWREYKKFLHGVNGYESILIDEYGNCFPARVENPGPAPTLADSTSGAGPSGKYAGYVSYLVTWPNGMQYETGLCPESGTVEVTDNAISWSSIPVSSYAAHYSGSYYNFNTCVMLLRFNGADGDKSATDVAKNKAITFVETAQQDTAQYKFGTASLLLDGDSDYIYVDSTDANINDFCMGTGAFTIDFWVRFSTVVDGTYGLFSQYENEDNWVNFFYSKAGSNAILRFEIKDTGSDAMAIEVGFFPSADTWYHIALIRGWGGEPNDFAVTVNGTQASSTVTDADTWPSIDGDFAIGRSVAAGPVYYYLNGWIDDFRVTKGAALWTANFTAPTEPAVAASIKRKLYRGPGTDGTLSDIYYVDTIHDNTTTTYTDSFTDVQLETAGPSYVDELGPGPVASPLIEYHYGRVFLVDRDYPWRLWYSEAAQGDTEEENENLLPTSFLPYNYDDIRVAAYEKTEIQSLLAWGTNFFIGLKHTWIRRQGNDPDTWSYKKTWAKHGVCSKDTVGLHKHGIIYLTTNEARQTGLAIFNGQTSDIVTTPKFDGLFNGIMDEDYASTARGTVAGNYYFLSFRDYLGAQRLAVFDLRRFPEIRLAYWSGIGGSAELMAYAYDRTFAGASNWANVDFASYNESGDLSLSASAVGQYCVLPVANASTTAGLRHTLSLDVSSCTSTFTIYDYSGTYFIAKILGDGTAQKFNFYARSAGGLRITADTATSSANFDNFSLKADGVQVVDAYSQGYDETNKLGVLAGTTDGYVFYDDPSTDAPIDIITKDYIGAPQIANDEKILKELRYNILTRTGEAWLEVWIDGQQATWSDGAKRRAISGSGDSVQVMRDMPPSFRGRRFSFRVFVTSTNYGVVIYSPWTMVFDVVE